MENSDFFQLLREVTPVMSKHIKDILPQYEEIISSKRHYSKINNFQDLVKILIVRDFIDPSNELTWSLLNEVCIKYGSGPFYNSRANGFEDVSSPQLDPRIVNYLTKHISLSWRKFARALKVRQGDIDKIEVNYEKDFPRCVREVLNIYMNQLSWVSNGDVRDDILTALRELGRNKLIDDFKRLTVTNQPTTTHTLQ